MSRRARYIAAPVIAAALIITGCSSDSGNEVTESTSGEQATTDTANQDGENAQGADDVDFLDFDTTGSVGLTVPAGGYFIAPIPQETIDTLGWDTMDVEQKASNDLATPLPIGEAAPSGADVVSLDGSASGLVWKAGDTPGEVTISYAYDPVGDGAGKVQASMTVTIE